MLLDQEDRHMKAFPFKEIEHVAVCGCFIQGVRVSCTVWCFVEVNNLKKYM